MKKWLVRLKVFQENILFAGIPCILIVMFLECRHQRIIIRRLACAKVTFRIVQLFVHGLERILQLRAPPPKQIQNYQL